MDCPLLCNPPLPSVVGGPACGLSDPAGRAMFLNVMMHSTCSPAYTAGSFHCTYARMFDGADGVGIVDNAAASQLAIAITELKHSPGLPSSPDAFHAVDCALRI